MPFQGDLKVYDVTKYLKGHPGGAAVLLKVGGQNAQVEFDAQMHSEHATNQLKKYLLGVIGVSTRSVLANCLIDIFDVRRPTEPLR
jgi:cytochrome b involved in lipid metabolism